MKRREFITLLGGAAAAWPLAARPQPAMPVIGFLHPSSPEPYRLRAFRQSLKDVGFVEGENVTIEYRWADNQLDRLPALAAELAVKLGLVTSLARPGGNLTGINFLASELAATRLELLRELVPGAAHLAVLVNSVNAPVTESTLRDVGQAARAMELQIQVFSASTIHEINATFAALANERPDAVFVANDPFFDRRRVQLAQLAAHHSIPAIHQDRLYPEVGGLMSYGASVGDALRQVSVYTGRILKGAKPSDLPVVQSTKFELVINASTARMLRLPVPPTLLVAADEVIE